jgi:hypothetical protein
MSEDKSVKWRQEFSKLNPKKVILGFYLPISLMLTFYIWNSSGESFYWSMLIAIVSPVSFVIGVIMIIGTILALSELFSEVKSGLVDLAARIIRIYQ